MGVSMQFIFLDMAGATLFTRNDAERAQWTQEEMTLECEFPYLDDKRISIGQRIFFKDPSTGETQIYEVKQAAMLEPDHYQTVTAENICISELSDEHIDSAELNSLTASAALAQVLSGTLWSVGDIQINPTSTGDVSRGSVWQAVLQIKDNWNVYIEPRLSIASNGAITRFLDIKSTEGTWNGVRLSIDKNMLDPSVTYDDSELVTALFGYGGTKIAENTEEEDKEIDFTGIAWTATSTHPAKPLGQKYIEDPEATQLYGRNGRPRFGFYQNTDIEDPELLLQKTWESLQTSSKPTISIEGTVADLYRMGYADQPIKLHDIALVEVLPAGYKSQIQIIRMSTDLLDPSATTLTIGAYIPNIVYIERKTNESATGSRGGGGGNKSKQTERSEYETAIEKSNRRITLRAYQNDLDDLDNDVKLQEARIDIEHNRITMEVADRRDADGVLSSRITQTATEIRSEVNNEIAGVNSTIQQTAYMIRTEVRASEAGLQSQITQTANAITAEVNRATGAESSLSGRITVTSNKVGLVVEEKDGQNVVNSASIVAGINSQSGSYAKIQAAKINLDGYVTSSMLESAFTSAQQMATQQMTISQYFTCLGYNVEWKTYTARHCSLSSEYYFNDYLGTQHKGRLVTGYTDTTIYYLGR